MTFKRISVLLMGLIIIVYPGNVVAQPQTEKADVLTIKAFPLNQNLIHSGNNDIRGWTIPAVKDTLSFGPDNWRQKLEFSSRYFSISGWEEFVSAMQASYILDIIQLTQESATTTKTGSVKEWKEPEYYDDKSVVYLEIPITIVLQANQKTTEINYTLRVTVKSRKLELGLYPQITSWNWLRVQTEGD